MEHTKQRIASIFEKIPSDDLPEAIFIFNKDTVDKNFFYVTGLFNGVFDNCGVICRRDGKVSLFTTSLEEEAARSIKGNVEIIVYKGSRSCYLISGKSVFATTAYLILFTSI